MDAGVIWGIIFSVGGAALIVWDIISTRAASTAAGEVEKAKKDLDEAIARLDAVRAASSRGFGPLNAEHLETFDFVTAEADEAATKVKSAKDSLLGAFDTALNEMAKAHSKLVVGAGLLVLAAGAFGAPIPFVP